MNIIKLIGFGALIWAVAFVVISGFIAFDVGAESTLVKASTLLALVLITLLLAKNLGVGSAKEMLQYSIVWLIIVLILDMVVCVRFTGWELLTQWNVIVGYLVILLVPLLVAGGAKKSGSKS